MRVTRRAFLQHAATAAGVSSILGLAGAKRMHVPAADAAESKVFRFPFREPDWPIDPNKGATLFNSHYMVNLFEGLGAPGPGGRLLMVGATGYQVSGGGQVYTFSLRKDGKWSDGTPVTAHDYEFSWKRGLDPKTGNVNVEDLNILLNATAYNHGSIQNADLVGVKALDDYTLQATLEKPIGWFLNSVASETEWYPVPRAAVIKFGDKWTEAGNIVTNGPFTIQSWQHDREMVLVANPNYWGPKPSARIVISMTNDPQTTSVAAYQSDGVDYAWVPATDLNKIRGDARLSKELHVSTLTATWFVVLDTTSRPFDDIRVRRAFYLSLDRAQLTQQYLQGAFKPATSLIPPGVAGYTTNLPINGGVEEARRLMSEAGFPEGRGFPTVVYTVSNLDQERLIAQALQQIWKQALNVTMELQVMERRAYQAWRSSRKAQPFNLHEGGWTAIGFADPEIWHNGMLSAIIDRQNHHWKNAGYQDLIARAEGERNTQTRASLYQQAERIVAQEVPVIPWGYRTKTYLLKPYVNGLQETIDGYVDLFQNVRITR